MSRQPRPASAARAALVLAAVLGGAPAASAAAGAAGDSKPCRVTAEVAPATAFVGQQVIYRVRIVRREDVARVEWVLQPGFPGFRAEWLPGRPEDTEMHYRGVRYLAREEQRALFPARAGELLTTAASIRCTLERAGPRPAESVLVPVPAVRTRVVAPPERGQPRDFTGVIGPVHLTAIVEPREISLGRSVSVSLSVRGEDNLWDVQPPLADGERLDGADVFASPPELELTEGERLQLKRYFRYEIVPRRRGVFVFPAIRIPFYDPRTGRYETAVSQPIPVDVGPRAAEPAGPRPRRGAASRAGSGSESESPGGPGVPPWPAALLAAAALAAAAAWGWIRRGRDPWRPVEAAMAEAERAAEAGDPIAEAAALRRGLGRAVAVAHPEIADADPAALRARDASDPLLAEVASLLEALDWIRFSSELGHPDRRAARDAVAALRERVSEGRR